MAGFKIWISAFRLRTLPLALASIALGAFLAAYHGLFSWAVFLMSALTTVCLQILSNLANDYGDHKHGADSLEREGPSRAVQSGAISPGSMKKALYAFAGLSLASGLALLYISVGFSGTAFIVLLALGLLAIAAAIAYTNGKRPYGYAGLGDVSVLIFFGLIGGMGSMYLHTGFLSWAEALPALSCGFFATAVLNVNNIRDIRSDRSAGKRTIPVRIGREKAVYYHWALLFAGIALAVAYGFIRFESWRQFIFLIAVPLFVKNAVAVKKFNAAADLDPYLKQLAMSTLLFVLAFGAGLLIR